MRAAQIQDGVVINFAEVDEFSAQFIYPFDAVVGSTWNGSSFSNPPAPSTVVPQQVTMRQAQTALLNTGLLDTVNSLIAGMTGTAGKKAQIDWAKSSEVRRDWPLIKALAPALGLTEAQIDTLFIDAAKL